MFPEHFDQVRGEAVAAFPNEVVWLITKSGCRLVKNVHPEPTKYFSVTDKALASAMAKGLLAVVHSHPGGYAAPSEADMLCQLSISVPFGVIATDGETASEITWWGANAPRQPLLGRGFVHGVTDCYGLIRDYYLLEMCIDLPDIPRNWHWWESGDKDLVSEWVEKAGFQQVSQEAARPGDIWFAQLRSAVPNHGGVLVAGDMILHQQGATKPVDRSRLSIKEPLARYQGFITHWMRHKDSQP